VAIIVIDGGHGGNDVGAVGENITEKEVVLDISLLLYSILENTRHTPVLTRKYDKNIPLKKRAEIANGIGADLFISIHNNGATNPQANGIETWYHRNSIQGKKLAKYIQEELIQELERSDRGIKHAGQVNWLNNDFYVLRTTNMPAVLLEIGFITNPKEEQLLKSCQFKYLAAQSIYDGIIKYLRKEAS